MVRGVLTLVLVGCTGEIATAPPRFPSCGEPSRLSRVTGSQYRAVVQQLLPDWKGAAALEVPFSQPRRTDLFSSWASQASVGEFEVDEVWASAELVANEWVKAQKQLCLGAQRTPACLQATWAPFLEKLWSRPASSEELEALGQSLAEAEFTSPAMAATAVAREALMSADFLFRRELGAEGALTPYEVAAALSFSLVNAPPDQLLREAARTGELTTTEGVSAQTRRLLERPETVPALRQFVRELFQFELAAHTFKDRAKYPFHRPNELVADTELVIDRLVATHARSGLQRALLTSDLVYARPTTAKSWGVSLSVDAGTFLTDPSRSGVLTHPAWLVAMSEPDHNHLVRRGRFVRERLLCGEVPNLPGGVVPQVEQKPGMTFRQRVEQHSADPSCAGCHQLMDPLGTGFEAWDHVGRAQTMDNGAAVSTTGVLDGAGDVDGPYTDARQLMQRLADSPTVRACWVKQLYQSVRGRPATDADACELGRLTAVYESTGEDTLAVIEAIFTSDQFLHRQELAP